MKLRFIVFLLLAFAAPSIYSVAQQNDNVCYINNNRIYFQLDKRWSDKTKKETISLFSLDSSLVAQAFTGISSFTADSVTWDISRINENIVEISKPLPGQDDYRPNDVLLIDDNWFVKPFVLNPMLFPPKKFGVNQFAKEPTIQFADSITHFYLPGFQNKRQVYLSGTFNNWSTMQHPMQKTGSGWEISLKLEPGRYLYKYITDGRWIHDPENMLKEADGENGYNSILYCYNHEFRLKGFTDARKVYVTGSFNGWKNKELRMKPVAGGWSLPIYLVKGTHAYKFIVDRNWITDPDNNDTRLDAYGNMNSFMGIGDTLIFKLQGFQSAEKVILSGSFNAWSHNELVMNKTDYGWELPYVLDAGNYEYKFIVDGKWITDPANPVTTGTGDFMNSCVTFKPNYTFSLAKYGDAKTVIVTGSFNGWSEDSYHMFKENGIWVFPVNLKPGKYTYKLIVDGRWMIDPTNELWEENEFGTGNSVLWIER
jgi:hypothetical protein